MAFEYPGQIISFKSSGNLSAKQFYCLKAGGADGNAALQETAGGVCVGVQQNTPSTSGGDGVAVMINGVTKAIQPSTSNAAITRGGALIASTAGGVIMRSTGSATQWIVGRAQSALSSGTTGVVSMMLTLEGYASTGV